MHSSCRSPPVSATGFRFTISVTGTSTNGRTGSLLVKWIIELCVPWVSSGLVASNEAVTVAHAPAGIVPPFGAMRTHSGGSLNSIAMFLWR